MRVSIDIESELSTVNSSLLVVNRKARMRKSIVLDREIVLCICVMDANVDW